MVRASLQREIEFRANFWAKVGQNLVWVIFFFLILKVIFAHTNSVAGWSEGKMFLLFATIFFLSSVVAAIFGMSVQEIPTLVRMGTMDYVLVKPVDTQFWVSVRLFSFDQLGGIVASVGLVAYAISREAIAFSPIGLAMYMVLVVAAIIIFYSLQLAMMTLGIWLVRVDNLWVLGESIYQVARFPINIFPPPMQRFFMYVLPLAFIASVPTRALWGAVGALEFWMGIGWAVVAFVISRSFWRFALRHYTSASS